MAHKLWVKILTSSKLIDKKMKIFGYNLLKEVIKLLTNRDRDYYEAPLNFLK